MNCSILHLTETGGQGGAEQVMISVLDGLAARGCAGIAVASREGWVTSAARRLGHHAYALPSRGAFDPAYAYKLARLVRRHSCDLIIAHMYGAATYAAMVGAVVRVPVIGVLHGHSDVPVNDRHRLLRRALFRVGLSHLVFVSEQLREALMPKIGITRDLTSVISNGVDFSRFTNASQLKLRRELQLTDEAVIVGSVGNFRKAKDYPTLLRAARLVVNNNARVHFVVIGDITGPLSTELVRMTAALELNERVFFLGYREDVADLLVGMDIFVSSSTTEGFSIACIEAMAASLPVVATRSGGPEQFIQHGCSGFLVDTGDSAGIASRVLELARSRDLRVRLGSAGRARIEKEYSLEATLDSYYRLVTL